MCLQKSPAQRPSINSLLKLPVLNRRISNYLNSETLNEEFAHTVLHNQNIFQNSLASNSNAVQQEDDEAQEIINQRKREMIKDIELLDETVSDQAEEERLADGFDPSQLKNV